MSDFAICQLEEEDRDRWNHFIDQSDLGCFFHKYEYLKTVENGLNLKPAHVVVKKDGNIVGGFTGFVEKIKKTPFRRLCSVPFGYGGPVVIADESEVLDLMFEEVRNLAKKEKLASQLVKTANLGYARFGAYFSRMGYNSVILGCSFVIDIDKPYSEIESRFSKERRYNVRKARKSPLSVEEPELTKENLLTFYDIYKRTMGRLGVDPRPHRLFEEIRTNLQDRTKLVLAQLDGKCIGGLLHFLGKRGSTIYNFLGCSDVEYNKYYPTDLLHEYSMKWGIRNEYQHYDLGATPALFDDGVFRYKEQWGGKLTPLLAWEKSYSKVRWSLFRAGRYLYKKLRQT